MNKENQIKFINKIKKSLEDLVNSEEIVPLMDRSIAKEKLSELLYNESLKFEKYVPIFFKFCDLISNIDKIQLSNLDDNSIFTLKDLSFGFSNNILKISNFDYSLSTKSLILDEKDNLEIYSTYNKLNIKSCIHILEVRHNSVPHHAMWVQEEKFRDYFVQELFNELLIQNLVLKNILLEKCKLIKHIQSYFINPLYNSIDVDLKLNLNKIPDSYSHLLEININTYKKENVIEIRDLILVNCDIDIFDKVGTFLKETNILKNKI